MTVATKSKSFLWSDVRDNRQREQFARYREFVNWIATGKPMDVSEADELNDILAALGITYEQLNADVEAYLKSHALRADLGDVDARIRQHNEEAKRQGLLMRELRQQLLEAEHKQRSESILAQSVASARGELQRMEARHPRVFGDIENALERLHDEPTPELRPEEVRPWHSSGTPFARQR